VNFLMKKLWIALLSLMIIAASCVVGVYLTYLHSSQPSGIEITDQLGRKVYVKKAERIVSLWPEATRVLFALGAGDKIVGLDSSSRICPFLTKAFPQIRNVADVGNVMGTLSLEKIAELNPDVVFMYTDNPELAENIQTTLNVPVVCVRFNPPSTKDWSYDIISIIGSVIGRQEKASKLRAYLEQKLSEVTSVTSALPDSKKPKVYVTMSYDPLITLTWSSEVDYAGGINVAKNINATRPWMKVSLEQVIAWSPDIIIIPGICIPGRKGIAPEDLLNNPDWQAINAVKNGKVYKVTWLGFFGFDPAGTVISTFQRAKLFHPNLFKNLDVEREGNEIFKVVYGVDGLYTKLKKESGSSI